MSIFFINILILKMLNLLYYLYDPTYMLVIIGIVLSMLANASLRFIYSKYLKVPSMSGIRGVDAALAILRNNGIYDVQVLPINGELTDNYNPVSKTVNLSEGIYYSTSIAAISVAAHECGHAIQHNSEYLPLTLRTAVVPLASISGALSWPLIVIGFLLSKAGTFFIQLGIFMFLIVVLFQIITLPVEYDASARALKQLKSGGIIQDNEIKGAKKVLDAAALTYVAVAVANALQLLRLMLLSRSRRG